MKPITVLLIDPRTPRRPTASIVRLLPDCKAFATVLGCSETRQSVLPDGTPIVVNDGPLEDHYDRLVGGYVYVMRKSWPDAICGPLLVTGPLDKHNRPTSLPSEALRTSPNQFMAGWLTFCATDTVKLLTRLTVVATPHQ